MITKVINTGDSSSGLVAIVAIVLILGVGVLLYSQGVFGSKTHEVNINLPDGKAISGSIKE